MSFTFTATFDTVAELSAFMVRIREPQAALPTAPKVETVAPAPKIETPASKVDYPTLQKAVFKLANAVTEKGLDPQEHVVSIAKKFGFKNFKDMAANGAAHFAAALEAVEAKLDDINVE